MLVVFAPQIVLYGLAVVLYGILQAHRRFTGPAVAPAGLKRHRDRRVPRLRPPGASDPADLRGLSRAAELTLSVGTTLGGGSRGDRAGGGETAPVGLRPMLRFPPGVASRVRRLAVAGLATVAAQQLATIGVVFLTNGDMTTGAPGRLQLRLGGLSAALGDPGGAIATSAFPFFRTDAERT